MKKIILGAAVFFATLVSAQYYPNNGWGNDGYSNGSYSDRDDEYYFPDDYYYEYPDDYYSDDYYNNYYDDYRRSISMINWQRFFMEYRLSRMQINMILDLNRQFDSFYTWNSYYRMNPNRWFYDRFYALERILGPRIFIVFQNNYYNGYSPVVYYTNRWNNYYRPRYHVMPYYRTVNINIYKVNRYDYHRSVGNQYGWNQPRNSHNPGGFREDNNRNSGGFRNPSDGNRNQNGGFRNQNDNGGFRGNNSGTRENTTRNDNRGFRGDESNSGTRENNPRVNNGGFRGNDSGTRSMETPRSSENRGFRNGGESQRNSSPRIENSQRSSQENSGSSRSGGGFRGA